MKRPLLILSLSALSGVLWGIREADLTFKTALTISVIAGLAYQIKSRGMKPPLLFLTLAAGVLFISSAMRSSYTAGIYESGSDFFLQYAATNPGQFDYALYLKGEGIDSEEKLREKYDGYTGNDPIKKGISDLRETFGSVLDRYMSPADSGIYKAILLGDKSDMDSDISDLYQASGISHIIAVSGMHISLVGMSVFRLFKWLRLGKKLSLTMAGIVSAFYVMLTGASGSALRAFIMLICRFLAIGSSKSYDMISSIALAMMVLIFYRPYMVLQSGFQLSFLAVFGISFLGDMITCSLALFSQNKEHGRLRRYIRPDFRPGNALRTVISNLSVQSMTLPAITFHFFKFPLYGILLNFAVIPLMSFVMYSGIAVLFTGILADVIPGLRAAAIGFGGSGHYILELYEKLCSISVSLPQNELAFGRPGIMGIILYYLIVTGSALGLRHAAERNLLSVKGGFKRKLLIGSFFTLGFIFPAFLLVRHQKKAAGIEITALDVGQGDCFILRSGQNTAIFDGGSDSREDVYGDVIEPYLMNEGIRDIDLVFASHSDADHINGLCSLFREETVRTKKLILPAAAEKCSSYAELKEAFISSGGEEIVYAKEGMELGFDGESGKEGQERGIPHIAVLSEGDSKSDEPNRHSPVLLLYFGRFSMLFTGDMTEDEEKDFYIRTKELRERYIPFGVSILKVAHHGSKTSTSDQMLKAVRPGFALISYGRNNRFGHPHETVTERIERYGAGILGTGNSGAICISTDGERMEIVKFLENF